MNSWNALSEPVSIYIHVPFCIRKCIYCDFYSTPDLNKIPAFVSALETEIRLKCQDPGLYGAARSKMRSPKVETVYLGGGTPSVLPVQAVARILESIDRYCGISRKAEITLEANPGTLDRTSLTGLKSAGINRLSLGVQSFNRDKLKFLTRIHSERQSVQAIEQARKAGFENIGIDLMFALPDETIDTWKTDLDTAFSFGPSHLSCYMLTVEPDTPLGKMAAENRICLSGDGPSEKKIQFFLKGSDWIEQAGFAHYEISNFFRRPEDRSRHNSNYWNFTPYLGLGPAAHSFLEGPDHALQRSWNLPGLTGYLSRLEAGELPPGQIETLTLRQQELEWIMLGLRTREGIDMDAFNLKFSQVFQTRFAPVIRHIEDQHLGEVCTASTTPHPKAGRHFRLNKKGWTRLDHIVESFADKILS